jgi:predicted transcriptional regulator
MALLIPSKKGRIGPLSGELELQVMETLWAKGPMVGRDVYYEIHKQKDIAYTTALTVLDRLSKKGFVKKDRTSRRITFSPRISKDDYLGQVTGSLVQKAFETSPDLAVSAFSGLFSRMPEEVLDKLEKLIQEKRNGHSK